MHRIILITLMIISLAFIGCKKDDSPRSYYRYAPSSKGKDFKRLTYDILGFHLDIPNDFQISITGLSSLDVALIHQIGLDTSTFSDDWEVFEIGVVPFTDIPLEDAMNLVAKGYKYKHTDLEDLQPYSSFKIDNFECLGWKLKWPSKTGLTVYEWVILVKYKEEIRSIGVKTCRGDFLDRMPFYTDILYSYVPIKKVELP